MLRRVHFVSTYTLFDISPEQVSTYKQSAKDRIKAIQKTLLMLP